MSHAIMAIQAILERLGEMGLPEPSNAMNALMKVLEKLMGA